MKIEKVRVPDELYQQLVEMAGALELKVYETDTGCRVFVSREPVAGAGKDYRWHLSMSGPGRLPTWAELGQARDELLPEDAFMCIPHPPRAYWLNYNPNVLHLWQFSDSSLRDQFMFEGREAQRAGFGRPS